MYSDMSMRIIASSSPKRNSASVRASSVLPTPDGPRNTKEPVGRFGSLRPARDRRIAFETTWMAWCCPMTRLWSSSSMRMSFCVSASELEDRDARPHRDDVRDLLLADGRPLAALAGLPLLLQLALL